MENIEKNWIKDDISNYKITELKRIKKEIIKCSEAYKDVFNGAPFYENWDLESALQEIETYIKDNALILTSKYQDQIIGFLVNVDKVPQNQQKYVQYLNDISFIEEVGVLSSFRKKGIASEMVRILLLNYLKSNVRYLEYRTNAMRYFALTGSESFESMVMRIQKEDQIKRLNGEKIIIPELSLGEKQQFINQYIELIKYRPELDVSNSNALFRSIFKELDFSQKGNNYTFQKDPTGEGNDRIFPVVDLAKTLCLVKRRK